MGRIDVSEILLDPDFIDELELVHRVPGVNSFGVNTLTENAVSTVGSVQPASGKVLQRLPEAMRMMDVSSFWLKGTITASAPGKYSDIIVFKNRRYQIQTVQDWSNWGAGWCEGTCIAEVPA